MSWKPELEELAHRRELMQGMGGQAGIDRQHGRGKLTVRERLPLLADPAQPEPARHRAFAHVTSALVATPPLGA